MLPAQSHIYIDRLGEGILFYTYRPHTHIYDFTSDNTKVYNKPFRLRDLRQSIMKAKLCAPWPGGIHNNLLKHLPGDTLKILKEILNKIWISGDFPHQWRAAKVILIPKPNKDHANPPSYRPIALISCIYKVRERMINTRFIWYLKNSGY